MQRFSELSLSRTGIVENMARLFLVRHGIVESNSTGRLWGHTDIPLCADGIQQAWKVCERLSREKIAIIYSSDLRRSLDTATIIASPHQLSMVSCPELREINFGRFEGMTFEEIKNCYPEAEKLWAGANPELSFPDGESLKALSNRIDHFVDRLSEYGLKDTVLVVAHGGSLRMLLCRLMGFDLSHWWQISITHASITILDCYPEGGMLCLLNDTCHCK